MDGRFGITYRWSGSVSNICVGVQEDTRKVLGRSGWDIVDNSEFKDSINRFSWLVQPK